MNPLLGGHSPNCSSVQHSRLRLFGTIQSWDARDYFSPETLQWNFSLEKWIGKSTPLPIPKKMPLYLVLTEMSRLLGHQITLIYPCFCFSLKFLKNYVETLYIKHLQSNISKFFVFYFIFKRKIWWKITKIFWKGIFGSVFRISRRRWHHQITNVGAFGVKCVVSNTIFIPKHRANIPKNAYDYVHFLLNIQTLKILIWLYFS